MPELPEVETIKNQLSDRLPFIIEAAHFSPVVSSILKTTEFEIKGQTIEKISRHGKWLIFHLQQDKYILSHLGMSGSWIQGTAPSQHKHAHLKLSGPQGHLNYVDPRRFGYMHFFHKSSLQKKLEELGPDITHKDFNEDHIKKCFSRFPQREIKPFLLDQKYFAGVGNYMACEICAYAGLRPTRRASTLFKKERQGILKAIHKVVFNQTKRGGNTFSGGYRDSYGEKGEGVQNLVVFYQQDCGLCQRKKVVKKIQLKGRGTYYCPHCQN